MMDSFLGQSPQYDSTTYIADTAVVLGDVTLGAHASVWPHCTLRGDVHWIRVGPETNIQDNTVVHVTHGSAPTDIGARVTIGHGAIIHGCTIEDEVLVGMGATVLDHARIGTHSIVGAQALVTKRTEIPPRSLVLGQPAEVVRELTDQEVASIRDGADNYVRYAAVHAGRETPADNPWYDPASAPSAASRPAPTDE
jgi:carbonic anhydrase/acetyltransferase-like protein (isoleucine patch superfamily)